MGKHRSVFVLLGFGVLILLVVLLFIRGTARQTGHIQLPEDSTEVPGDTGPADASLDLVEITEKTVQQAIASMRRPAAYSRTVTITTYYTGGSASTDIQTAVDGPLTRLDIPTADGGVRHLLTDGETACIWYDEERTWAEFPQGDITVDQEQRIPTYEDILALPVESIVGAVYMRYEDLPCICVLTAEDEAGYDTAYWISVDTGLLVAAITRQNGDTVYEMQSLSVDTAVESSRFLLPDGSSLFSVEDTEG